MSQRLDEIITEMMAHDPEQTGCVRESVFKSILSELQPDLSNADLRTIARHYSCTDYPVEFGREPMVSYYRFLKPIALPHIVRWEMRNVVNGANATGMPKNPHMVPGYGVSRVGNNNGSRGQSRQSIGKSSRQLNNRSHPLDSL